MTLNNHVRTQKRYAPADDIVSDLRASLLGNKKNHLKEMGSRVSGGIKTFDMERFVTITTMTLVASVVVSVIAAVYVGFSGVTAEKIATAIAVCFLLGLAVLFVSDIVTPETERVRIARLKQQRKSIGAIYTTNVRR